MYFDLLEGMKGQGTCVMYLRDVLMYRIFSGHLIGPELGPEPALRLTRRLTDFALKSLGKFGVSSTQAASTIEERVVHSS